MHFWLSRSRRTTLCGILLLSLSASRAHALLKFNEGRDQLFVTGTFSVGYDSNIFASNGGDGDIFTNAGLALEYTRQAGLIGVNGSVAWNFGSFNSNQSENFSNPSLNLELVKNTGRTTGSFTLAAARQSQADATVGMRTDSWNYSTGLNWKYPVIERYSLAGNLGYGLVDYVDNSVGLVDLNTYTASVDLFYAYTSQRDLLGGYRIRVSDALDRTIDHALTAGISGKILSKLNGTIRGGYQIRQETATGETFSGYTATASATWTVNKRLNLTASLNKDFSTTATDSTVDTSSFNVDAQYTLDHHWSVYTGAGVGYNRFLSGIDTGRRDFYATWSAGLSYSLNEHFKASLTYSYFHNWSNRTISDYDRHSISLNLSSRW